MLENSIIGSIKTNLISSRARRFQQKKSVNKGLFFHRPTSELHGSEVAQKL